MINNIFIAFYIFIFIACSTFAEPMKGENNNSEFLEVMKTANAFLSFLNDDKQPTINDACEVFIDQSFNEGCLYSYLCDEKRKNCSDIQLYDLHCYNEKILTYNSLYFKKLRENRGLFELFYNKYNIVMEYLPSMIDEKNKLHHARLIFSQDEKQERVVFYFLPNSVFNPEAKGILISDIEINGSFINTSLFEDEIRYCESVENGE